MRMNRLVPAVLGLVAVAGQACSSSTDSNPTPSGDVTIVQNASTAGANAFSPNPFTESFATQSSVKWANLDVGSGGYGGGSGVTHRLVSNTGLFDSGNIGPGSTYIFTFAGAGTYQYHCSIHPAMVGTITLTP